MTHTWNTGLQQCVCAADYYQTTPATADEPAVCTDCPPGSTTNGETNSQDITGCSSKYGKIFIPIPRCYYYYIFADDAITANPLNALLKNVLSFQLVHQ